MNQAKAGSVPGHGQYENDRKRYWLQLQHEDHKAIACARSRNLEKLEGSIDLLLISLVSFDPNQRSTALELITSSLMESLRHAVIEENDKVQRSLVGEAQRHY